MYKDIYIRNFITLMFIVTKNYKVIEISINMIIGKNFVQWHVVQLNVNMTASLDFNFNLWKYKAREHI